GAPPGWRWPRWWTWVGPGAQGGLVAYVNTPRTVRSREFRWCGERYLHAEAELKERAPAQTTSPRERCNHAGAELWRDAVRAAEGESAGFGPNKKGRGPAQPSPVRGPRLSGGQ